MRGQRAGQDVFTVWLELPTLRLNVSLALDIVGVQHRLGPVIDLRDGPIDIQLAFHPGMGPGGILWRRHDEDPWSSMESASARGVEAFAWPPLRRVAQEIGAPSRPSRPLTFNASHATVAIG